MSAAPVVSPDFTRERSSPNLARELHQISHTQPRPHWCRPIDRPNARVGLLIRAGQPPPSCSSRCPPPPRHDPDAPPPPRPGRHPSSSSPRRRLASELHGHRRLLLIPVLHRAVLSEAIEQHKLGYASSIYSRVRHNDGHAAAARLNSATAMNVRLRARASEIDPGVCV
jgi:hypothetical protein